MDSENNDLITKVIQIAEGVKSFKEKAADNEREIAELKKNIFGASGSTSAFEKGLEKGIRENYERIKKLGREPVSFVVKAATDMTFATNFSTADSTVTQSKPGIVSLPNRKVHVRQLLRPGTMSTSDFAYVKETGGEGAPAPWQTSDGAKTQFDIDLADATAPSQYIAGFMVISRKMLDDVDGTISFLQGRLYEKYLKAEDTQLLTGNGTPPNISGLITNATAATSTADNDYDQLIDALAQLEASDYNGTGILINPSIFYKLAKYKASSSGLYDKPGMVYIENGQLFFNGVPVYKSTAITAKTYLVGDFEMGAQLMIREDPRVEFFEQDSTNVRNNKVTIRVEGRVSLPIYSSKAFITGTFADY